MATVAGLLCLRIFPEQNTIMHTNLHTLHHVPFLKLECSNVAVDEKFRSL